MKIIERLRDIFFIEQWELRFNLCSGMPGTMSQYEEIRPPKDRFWADPHVIFHNDLFYIFFEEFIYKNKKGHISVIAMDQQGKYSAPVPVLEAGYHLSYPFVFEHKGEVYMIPESCDNHTIELYKSVQFPHEWEFQMNIMSNVVAVDTTLYFSNDKWWLFTNMAEEEGEGTWQNLFLFSSDTLFSDEWSPHPQNPIVSGVGNARPAGALFRHQGKLYRPSQDSSVRYGYSININEILCLDKDVYSEKVVASIKPDWGSNVLATHTFAQVDALSVTDAQIRRWRWP